MTEPEPEPDHPVDEDPAVTWAPVDARERINTTFDGMRQFATLEELDAFLEDTRRRLVQAVEANPGFTGPLTESLRDD